MPLNLLVVDTAAVSVKLRLDPIDGNGNSVLSNSPLHVKDKVYIDRVDFTAFAHIGTLTKPVYHRLVVTLPAEVANDFVRPTTGQLPTETISAAPGPRRYIPLTPDTTEHATKFATVPTTSFRTFTSNRITFLPGGANGLTGTNTYLGTITRKSVAVTKTFKFDFQFQYDAMDGGVLGEDPNGPLHNAELGTYAPNVDLTYSGLWYEYQQETDSNDIVTGSDSLSYKVKIYHVARENYDPNPDTDPTTRMWYAGNNLASGGGVITPSVTFNIAGDTYTPAAATVAQAYLDNQLWSDPLTKLIPNPAIDYIFEVADADTASTNVDDKVDVTTIAFPRISIAEHLVYRQGGQLITSGNTLKLFRGRSTRIYTDLTTWTSVCLHSFDLAADDDDSLAKTDTTLGTLSDWITFDGNQTVVGVGIASGGTVYLQVYLGPNSTGVRFDSLFVTHDTATTNLLQNFPNP